MQAAAHYNIHVVLTRFDHFCKLFKEWVWKTEWGVALQGDWRFESKVPAGMGGESRAGFTPTAWVNLSAQNKDAAGEKKASVMGWTWTSYSTDEWPFYSRRHKETTQFRDAGNHKESTFLRYRYRCRSDTEKLLWNTNLYNNSASVQHTLMHQ